MRMSPLTSCSAGRGNSLLTGNADTEGLVGSEVAVVAWSSSGRLHSLNAEKTLRASFDCREGILFNVYVF